MQKLNLTKKYERYPEYKDSGVEWIGQIPEGWDLASSRRLFDSEKELVGSSASEYKILSLTLRGVIPRVLDGSGKNPTEYDTYQVFKKGDLVFCLFDYDVTPRTIGHVDEDGMLTGAYTRLMPKSETFSKYFYYYFLSLDYTKELLHLCTGLRNSVPKPIFWSMKSPLPSIETQQKIATYLDEKTALIDQIIEKKKKQIELLREKRTAVINHAVTKGLDPKAELVESGIEWIGKIPKGWGIYKIKYLYNFQSGDGFPDNLQGSTFGEIPFLKVSDINGEELHIRTSNNYVTHEQVKNNSWHLIPEDSILMAKIGAALSKNHRKINIIPVCIDNNMMAMTYKKNIDAGFAYWLSKKINMTDFQNISSVPSINMTQLKNSKFVIPNIDDQKEIVKYLDKQATSHLEKVPYQ